MRRNSWSSLQNNLLNTSISIEIYIWQINLKTIKMTDNFENYKLFLRLYDILPELNRSVMSDRYYVVELIRRGKDNPTTRAANYHFKNYYIYSMQDLDKYADEIKKLCDTFNLRAYASVNCKYMTQVAHETLAEGARRLAAGDCKKFYNIFESCSGKFRDNKNKLWVVDVDKTDCTFEDLLKLQRYINNMPSRHDSNVVYSMPTRSGIHLICRPFDRKKFKNGFMEYLGDVFKEIPTIQTNHLTLLYENLDNDEQKTES